VRRSENDYVSIQRTIIIIASCSKTGFRNVSAN